MPNSKSISYNTILSGLKSSVKISKTPSVMMKSVKFEKKGFISDKKNPRIDINDSDADAKSSRSSRSAARSIISVGSSRSNSLKHKNPMVEKKISYGLMIQTKATPSKNGLKSLLMKQSAFKKEAIEDVIKSQIKYKNHTENVKNTTEKNPKLVKATVEDNSKPSIKNESEDNQNKFYEQLIELFRNLNIIFEVRNIV